jgi:ArsR family transcriptional regulator, arsenate/arsenite/antimonite-responsive transcriptional repressor
MKSKQAIDALAALAQETRLAIFRLLVREGPEGLAAGAIAERLDIPAPTLSFHLAQLSRADLVTPNREGRSIRYAANYRGMNALLTYITEDCCQGRSELCGPQRSASATASAAAVSKEEPHETAARLRRR